MNRLRLSLAALRIDTRGTALVEFAIVAPLLLMILLGTIGYGGYFWRAHALQQAANDAARAALGGLTLDERALIAQSAAAADLAALGAPAVARTTVEVTETGGAIRVAIAYDARPDPFMRLGLVPMPDPVIRRDATVRLGGL